MAKPKPPAPGAQPAKEAAFRRAIESYWVERVIFCLGAVLIFVSEFFLAPRVESASEDVAYYERNVSEIQFFAASRDHSVGEYSRNVSAKPQDRELVSMSAFKLFTDTDELLSGLRAVVEQNGRGQVLSVLQAKRDRRRDAERELRNGDCEALVKRVNDSNEDHEQNVEPLTVKLMAKRQGAIDEKDNWSSRSKGLRLTGTLCFALAFLLREAHEYQKRQLKRKPSK